MSFLVVVSDTRRVLVVGERLIDGLAGDGCEVTVCHPAEAAAVVERVRPHLLLVDADRPDGMAAVRAVRGGPWGRRVRILAVGGWELDGRRAEVVAAGCDGCWLRPVAADEVAYVAADG